jgi:nucleoside-diphosphate-sugar epimerase
MRVIGAAPSERGQDQLWLDVSAAELARAIASVLGTGGRFISDSSNPDPTVPRLLDNARTSPLGWKPWLRLEEGVSSTCRWDVDNASGRQ